MQKIAKNVKETNTIAKIFLREILKNNKRNNGALVVALSGNLGAGKTAFAKAIAKNLGIKDKISSPTFVILKKYSVKLKGYKYFFHIDAYRLENEKDLQVLKWEEIISNKEHLVFIEWPEMVSKAIPSHAKSIAISSNEHGHRKFQIK